MTGPEHYTEAERLIARHDYCLGAGDYDYQEGADDLRTAQVHATLALAAATALGNAGVPTDGPTAGQWRKAICVVSPNG